MFSSLEGRALVEKSEYDYPGEESMVRGPST